MNEFAPERSSSIVNKQEIDIPQDAGEIQVDAAFASRTYHSEINANSRNVLQVPESEILPTIEFTHIDSRPDKEETSTPYFIILTGIWGRGPEDEDEIKTLALTMGKQGLLADAISLPGHGRTSNVKEGWNTDNDFKNAAKLVLEHIRMLKVMNPNRPIIIHAWSMGGITALNTVAMMEEIKEKVVDGVILVDTPAFPQDLKKAAVRFALYGVQKVKKEPPLNLKTKLKGLSIFKDRHNLRNTPEGMAYEVVMGTGRSTVRQNLEEDGTLKKVAQSKVPISVISGSNDFVIPKEQINRLVLAVKKEGGKIEQNTIEGSGHALVGEQPRKVASVYRDWMEFNGFLRPEETNNYSSLNKPLFAP